MDVVKGIIVDFARKWEQNEIGGKGMKYPIVWGKDNKIAQGLLNTYEPEQLLMMFDEFFKMDSDFVKQTGFTFGVFRTQIPKILADRKKRLDSEAKKEQVKKSQRVIEDNNEPPSEETMRLAREAMANMKIRSF